MRTTGLGFSTFLLAAGAILYWGVTAEGEGFSVNTIGIILMIAGAIGFLGTMALAATPSRRVVEEDTRVLVDESR